MTVVRAGVEIPMVWVSDDIFEALAGIPPENETIGLQMTNKFMVDYIVTFVMHCVLKGVTQGRVLPLLLKISALSKIQSYNRALWFRFAGAKVDAENTLLRDV